jgi:ribulose 1,5-bisphosphate synthetase/thiazole synthase
VREHGEQHNDCEKIKRIGGIFGSMVNSGRRVSLDMYG